MPGQLTADRAFIIVVRADPVVCGHSTEARNLAEAALETGRWDICHIVSYPMDILEQSILPLKESYPAYSSRIHEHRPTPVGDGKVLDGKVIHGMEGCVLDLLLGNRRGMNAVMSLYVCPHAKVVSEAVRSWRSMQSSAREACGEDTTFTGSVINIAEAVGSDITSQVATCLRTGAWGAAASLMELFLDSDVPIAVSQYTVDEIVEAAKQIDAAIGTFYEKQCRKRVTISFPAIEASRYLQIAHEDDGAITEQHTDGFQRTMADHRLEQGQYVLFLSRVTEAKGVPELIRGYAASTWYARGLPLVVAGSGPALAGGKELAEELKLGDMCRFPGAVSEEDKPYLMAGCGVNCFPTKWHPSFVETFGIAVAEQMLCGTSPLICTDCGGVPEAHGGHRHLIPEGDGDAVTTALDLVLKQRNDTPDLHRGQILAARNFAASFDRIPIFERIEHKVLKALTAMGVSLPVTESPPVSPPPGQNEVKANVSKLTLRKEPAFLKWQ
jgi:glycosyltransferase involved in cell wall biosynthesis